MEDSVGRVADLGCYFLHAEPGPSRQGFLFVCLFLLKHLFWANLCPLDESDHQLMLS